MPNISWLFQPIAVHSKIHWNPNLTLVILRLTFTILKIMHKNIHIRLIINIFIATIFIPYQSDGQENIFFKTYSATEGLPSGTINEIWKDKKGFLWLLSENTLTRFDGYDFITYRNKPNDSTSISSASVYKAVSDSSGNTFFQTYNSICKYDYSTGKFKQILKYSAYTDISYFAARNRTIYCIYDKHLILIDGTLYAKFTLA